jgi:hypothetical protein
VRSCARAGHGHEPSRGENEWRVLSGAMGESRVARGYHDKHSSIRVGMDVVTGRLSLCLESAVIFSNTRPGSEWHNALHEHAHETGIRDSDSATTTPSSVATGPSRLTRPPWYNASKQLILACFITKGARKNHAQRSQQARKNVTLANHALH